MSSSNVKLYRHKRKCVMLFFPYWCAPDLSLHDDAALICAASVAVSHACHERAFPCLPCWPLMKMPCLITVLPKLSNRALLNSALMCVMHFFFFSDRSFRPSLIKTNAPALFASATPSRPVKIDSLASSTRQLWAICSRLGSSSSFCFYDCSYNIMHAERKN